MKIYLAIPYTGFEEEAFEIANIIAAHLINQGNVVYSPVTVCHVLNKAGRTPGWENWENHDKAFIEWCDYVKVIIMNEDGMGRIDRSKGVMAEIKYADSLRKPITFIEA